MPTVPDDCADVFCFLYDRLQANELGAVQVEDLHQQCCNGGPLAGIVQEARSAAELTGRIPAKDYDVATALATLVGLHQALEHVDGFTATRLPSGLFRIRRRLVDHGRLNDSQTGALLLRRPRPRSAAAPADTLAALFPCLLRLNQDQWSRVGLVLPEFNHVKSAHRRGPLVVASLPWYTQPSDLAFGLAVPDRGLYSVWPSAALDRSQRVEEGLKALDTSGATLGLVPESTLDEATLDAWMSKCRETARGYSGPLRWILVGTGFLGVDVRASRLLPGGLPQEPLPGAEQQGKTNKAVILDRSTGEPVLTQDKNPGFTLTKEIVERYRQELPLGPGVHPEWLDSSSRLWGLELPIGRVVVLVCEALSRHTSAGATAASLSPDIILSPLLAMNLKPDRWAHRSALQLANEIGASVVVFNSKGLERRDNLTVSTMLTVVPQASDDAYVDLKDAFVPAAGQAETLEPEVDAVTARVGELLSTTL